MSTKTVPRELYVAMKQEADRWHAIADKLVLTISAPVVTERPSPTKRTKSPVAEAIKRESGGDPRLAAYLRKRATKLRGEGVTPADIAVQLGQWNTTETVAE